MTLEEAQNKIIQAGYWKNTEKALDFGDFWVFCFPEGEVYECPQPAIMKETGKTFNFFPPNYIGRKYKVIILK